MNIFKKGVGGAYVLRRIVTTDSVIYICQVRTYARVSQRAPTVSLLWCDELVLVLGAGNGFVWLSSRRPSLFYVMNLCMYVCI